jgi:hypothetical protein
MQDKGKRRMSFVAVLVMAVWCTPMVGKFLRLGKSEDDEVQRVEKTQQIVSHYTLLIARNSQKIKNKEGGGPL